MMRAASGRGALVVLASFLALSGALRLGAHAGPALASTATAAAQLLQTDAGLDAVPAPADAAGIEALLRRIGEREVELAAREAALAERTAAEERRLEARLAEVTAGEAELTVMLERMEAAEARLSDALGRADGAAEADLARLTEVYETMKPKDAARLFEAMEPSFAAGFLGRMRPEAAASVLAGMTSERAYAVSVIVAGRRADLMPGGASAGPVQEELQ